MHSRSTRFSHLACPETCPAPPARWRLRSPQEQPHRSHQTLQCWRCWSRGRFQQTPSGPGAQYVVRAHLRVNGTCDMGLHESGCARPAERHAAACIDEECNAIDMTAQRSSKPTHAFQPSTPFLPLSDELRGRETTPCGPMRRRRTKRQQHAPAALGITPPPSAESVNPAAASKAINAGGSRADKADTSCASAGSGAAPEPSPPLSSTGMAHTWPCSSVTYVHRPASECEPTSSAGAATPPSDTGAESDDDGGAHAAADAFSLCAPGAYRPSKAIPATCNDSRAPTQWLRQRDEEKKVACPEIFLVCEVNKSSASRFTGPRISTYQHSGLLVRDSSLLNVGAG